MAKETITRDNVISLYRATIAHDAQWLADFDDCSADDQLTIACEEMEFDPDAPAITATSDFNTGANDMANDLFKYATQGEARVARRLVKALLARELSVSVNDGGEWTVSKSRDYRTIVDALCTTGIDYLRAYAPTGDCLGGFDLVWGNCPTGEELISDYTDNDFCNRVYNAVYSDNAKADAQDRIGNIWDAQDKQEY